MRKLQVSQPIQAKAKLSERVTATWSTGSCTAHLQSTQRLSKRRFERADGIVGTQAHTPLSRIGVSFLAPVLIVSVSSNIAPNL